MVRTRRGGPAHSARQTGAGAGGYRAGSEGQTAGIKPGWGPGAASVTSASSRGIAGGLRLERSVSSSVRYTSKRPSAMKLFLVLLLLAVCVELSVQQGFWPGAVIGAGIALESAGVGYIAGRASRRHHHHRHHGYYGRRRRAAATGPPSLHLEVPQAALVTALESSEEEEDPALTAAVQEAELDAYFRVISAEDLLGCGLRLLCELGATEDESQLRDDQRNIIALLEVAEGPQAPSGGSPRARYVAAYRMGQTSGGVDPVRFCGELFPRCPADAEQILAALRSISR